MNWITPAIAIGNYLEAQDLELIRAHGFRSIVSLNGTLTPHHAAEMGLVEVASYRLIDGPGNDLRMLSLAVDDLCRLAEGHPPVLVHCHAGRSRSVIIVSGYLMRTRGLSSSAAIAEVARKREIHVAPELVELLERWE